MSLRTCCIIVVAGLASSLAALAEENLSVDLSKARKLACAEMVAAKFEPAARCESRALRLVSSHKGVFHFEIVGKGQSTALEIFVNSPDGKTWSVVESIDD